MREPRVGAAVAPPPRRGAGATRLLLAGGGAVLAIAIGSLSVIVWSGSRPADGAPEQEEVAGLGARAPQKMPPPIADGSSAPVRVTEQVAPTEVSPPAASRPDLETRVARDATEELRRLWATVVEGCPPGNGAAGDGPSPAALEFFVTFDANGDEIGRSPSGNRGASPGLGACFLARHDLRLRVQAPGREIQVTVRAPMI